MDSLRLASKPKKQRCFCALCCNSFVSKDENLYRTRDLHDLCRLLEEMPFPPMEPTKRHDLALLLENQLKQQQSVSLCDECHNVVRTLLRERRLAMEYQSIVNSKQQKLDRNLAELLCHKSTVSHQFNLIADAAETPHVDDFQVFRNRVAEVAKDLEMECSNLQQRLEDNAPDIPSIIPRVFHQGQILDASQPAAASTSELSTVPAPKKIRKRTASSKSDTLGTKPSKLLKLNASSADGRNPESNFKDAIITRARRAEDSTTTTLDNVGFKSAFLYDSKKDRLSLGNVEIHIDENKRNLTCGQCGWIIPQNMKRPGMFSILQRQMRIHILHQHLDIWEFKCARCGKGFSTNGPKMEKHVQQCKGVPKIVDELAEESMDVDEMIQEDQMMQVDEGNDRRKFYGDEEADQDYSYDSDDETMLG